MRVATILNRVEKYKCYVYGRGAPRPEDFAKGRGSRKDAWSTESIVSLFPRPPARYSTGDARGDDQCMYSGDDYDTLRWVNAAWLPVNDKVTDYSEARFGSAHTQGCNLLLCDGSVRLASYTIDRNVYESLGTRRDGKVVGEW